jgi:hypothetical protein
MNIDMTAPMSIRHKTKLLLDLNACPCTCKNENQNAAYKLYNTTLNINSYPVLVWNNCAKTVHASMIRHLQAVPLPDPSCVNEYEKFIDNVIFPELQKELHNFDYSYSEWYNHLDYSKQQEIKKIKFPITNEACTYNMFCKREIQLVDNPTDNYDNCGLPKTRAIAGPKPEDKYVLGPVTWALESVFTKHLNGYCGGKNWQEMEETIKNRYDKGYRFIIQGDGSGFDRTQSHELKYFDRKVYNYIEDKIHHIESDTFITKATARFRKLNASVFSEGRLFNIGSATIDATVTSGNPDTTLMNTARMAIYCRFMAYKANVEVEVDAKGDDFAIFVKNEYDAVLIKEQFKKYWANKNEKINEPYGLGLILKFLTIGDFTSYDFCSTHLICDFTQNKEKFKIVRQWNRITELGAYSMKALHYSKGNKNQYLEDMALSMEKWTSNMPYYKDYIKFIRGLIDGKKIPIKNEGKNKIAIPSDGHKHNHAIAISSEGYGRDYHYGLQLRQSNTVISDSIVLDFFKSKYQLTKSQIFFREDTLVVN